MNGRCTEIDFHFQFLTLDGNHIDENHMDYTLLQTPFSFPNDNDNIIINGLAAVIETKTCESCFQGSCRKVFPISQFSPDPLPKYNKHRLLST